MEKTIFLKKRTKRIPPLDFKTYCEVTEIQCGISRRIHT